jgi:acyl carrier protein/GNAT superfamily N-acetyltransferase
MTPAELEQRLLKFTREKLAAREVAPLITVDTRLFEDRVIDSLKVLELIAFVQSVLGRKIPDKHIVLANFRSIATIARVFTNGDPVASRPRSRSGPRPLSGRAFRRSDSGSPVTELIRRGVMQLTPEGGLIVRGAVAALVDHFDATVREWALDLGACEESFATAIPVATLERAGFVSAFPEKLIWNGESARPPAVCYHHYPSFSDMTLGDRGSIVTAVGRCYRNEHDPMSPHPEERLAAFTMREIIAVGNDRLVERLRRGMMDRVSLWLNELRLDGFIETATDPFFTSEGRGRRLMQQLLPLKYELRLRVATDGRSIAAASFNNHEQHFGRAFSIRLPSGDYAHSGCVAFGWERWVIAFVNQHGPNEANWPLALESTNVAALV